MSRRALLAVLILLVFLSCAHTEYFLEPVRFMNNHPVAPPSDPLGKIFLQDIVIDANSDRFVQRDVSRDNFLDALETVLWGAGYEVVDEPESPDTLLLKAKVHTLSNRGGCSGGWNTSELDVTIARGDTEVFQKRYANKRRGRSGPRAYTMSVRACLDQFWKDLASPRWRRNMKKSIAPVS